MKEKIFLNRYHHLKRWVPGLFRPCTYAILLKGGLLFTSLLTASLQVSAQDTASNKITSLPDVFKMAVANSVQLKIAAQNADLARQVTSVRELDKLPSVSTKIDYGYISNADIWTPSFSKHLVAPIPHQYTDFSVIAGEIIFKGNLVNNNLRRSTIEEQIAQLNVDKNTTDIKFLVAAQYLDIYRLIDQRKVFSSNLKLARYRLKNIQTMQKQGMVTQNDVLRTTLTISDLQLAIRQIDDNIVIQNRHLNMVTGQPDTNSLAPDTTLLEKKIDQQSMSYFIQSGYSGNHDLKIAGSQKKVAELNVKIAGSDRYPELSLFTGTDLQRPYTYSDPKEDVFYNVWEAGISLKYNISSIYQSPRKIKAAKIQLEETSSAETLTRQKMEVAISTAYIKYTEAQEDLRTYEHDLGAAEENYRIVEKKYFNQLALLTDILDAATTKLEAELKVTNAKVNTIYTYYQLLQSTGNIN
ncbi:TolC family protein [Mucilaginibacter kameinonensis]|uniref:TolC family protein n=1 Tax=Mucilaginibacter kameinonensis TaxID=452286 RepID=UPI000EF7BEBE|nr:TolC family protein [Mucilaginibacter kameinonensis]